MNRWALAIDFGTSYTRAAVRLGARTVAVMLEQREKLPSGVGLIDGALVTGEPAQRLASRSPEALDRTPKRRVGEESMILGAEQVRVSDMLAAIFARVLAEAEVLTAPDGPVQLRLTHPARWSELRLSTLREAAATVGFEYPVLVPQPVAVALSMAPERIAIGQHVGVYDLGGGIFEAAVLSRTPDCFRIVGFPVTVEPSGGELFDEMLMQLVRQRLTTEQWERVRITELGQEIRMAKETLSQSPATGLHVPGLDKSLSLTSAELEEVVSEELERTVVAFQDAMQSAGLTPPDLATVYVAGGSSRLPFVARLLSDRLGITPTLAPASAAFGALFEEDGALAPSAAPASAGARPPEPAGTLRAVARPDTAANASTPETTAAAMAARASARESESVDCTVFAPSRAAPGSLMMVQVFLHTPGQAGDAAALASAFDPDATRRGFRGLELPLPKGATVEIELRIVGGAVDAPVQRLVWQGRPEAVQFDVHVRADSTAAPLAGHVLVRREGLPIGRIGFRIAVGEADGGELPTPQLADQRGFKRAFASYASADRREVLKRVQVLRSAGIECFQDVLDLEPGQRWERELYRRIDGADLFLLFWSRAAKRSDWVRREVRYALERQHGDPEAEPEICPVVLPSGRFRRGRDERPWEELSHLHFNDLVAQLL